MIPGIPDPGMEKSLFVPPGRPPLSLREAMMSNPLVQNSYVYALFSEKHADSLFAYCEEMVEGSFLKTIMESAVASAFMDLEEEGFPVRNHQVTIKMTFEEACAITHKNQSKESDKEVHH